MKREKGIPKKYDEIMLHDDFIICMREGGDNPYNLWIDEIEKNPNLKEEFEIAFQLHNMLSSHKKTKSPEEYKNKQTSRLLARLDADDKSDNLSLRRKFKGVAGISAVIIILLSLTIVQFLRKGELFDENGNNLQVIVPSGEKTQLILPDGTQVWLNSESKLIYPVNFTPRERQVTLEGEAYLEVAKHNKSQFTLYTQNFKVEVLGTKFNVKSYPKDRTIETTVIEGMVKVENERANSNFSPVILKPTERLIYKKDISSYSKKAAMEIDSSAKSNEVQAMSSEEIFIGHVNTKNITSWKDHLLVFDNETFEELAVKLSRWYKVEIRLQDEELKTQRYTGKFIHNESLIQVLEAIKVTTPIEYKMHEGKVEILLVQ